MLRERAALPLSLNPLPAGVQLHALECHTDARGSFTEIFRTSWNIGITPVQWNVVSSAAGVLRGVHVHPRHDDYLLLVRGEATVGLRDLRKRSSTRGRSALVKLEPMTALFIPHGVAHGFYFTAASIHVYAVSHDWDPADELGCHWADPALQINWRAGNVLLSPRDASAPPLATLLKHLSARSAVDESAH